MNSRFQVKGHKILGPNCFGARCAIGRAGLVAASEKKEGDLKTPIGVWSLRRVLYRADRLAPIQTKLSLAPIAETDGWCDAPDDPLYNRQVVLPYPASAERLFRDDHAYDIVVVLGYNDAPIVPGAGSAIFFHLAQPDWRGTEGCIAIDEPSMRQILAVAEPNDALDVVG